MSRYLLIRPVVPSYVLYYASCLVNKQLKEYLLRAVMACRAAFGVWTTTSTSTSSKA